MVFSKKMSAAAEIFAVILYIMTIFANFTRTDPQVFSQTSQGEDAGSKIDVKDWGGTKKKSQGGEHKSNSWSEHSFLNFDQMGTILDIVHGLFRLPMGNIQNCNHFVKIHKGVLGWFFRWLESTKWGQITIQEWFQNFLPTPKKRVMVQFWKIFILRIPIMAIQIANVQYSELLPFARNTEESALMVF